MGSGDLEMIESLQAQLVLERQKSTVLAAKVQELEARQRADAWMVPRLVKLLQEYCRLKNGDFASVVSGTKKFCLLLTLKEEEHNTSKNTGTH
jgi:hypothetical protein